MTKRSWLFRITLCLVLGVVTTVTVAWGCASRAHFEPSGFLRVGRANAGAFVVTFFERSVLGVSRVEMNLYEPPIPENAAAFPQGTLPLWVRADIDKEQDGYPIDAAGLPLRCLSCKWTDNWKLVGGIALSEDQVEWAASNGQGRSAIPLRPLYAGLVINTCFFGAIWFAVFLALGSTKRWNRKRRGLCPMCKYDLRVQHATNSQEPQANSSIYCPECGWGREEITTEAQKTQSCLEDEQP